MCMCDTNKNECVRVEKKGNKRETIGVYIELYRVERKIRS